MNIIRKHFYLLGFLLLMTSGCRSCETVESTKIAQSTIYQDYSVDASPFGTTVSATFRVGDPTGTTVDLDAPSRIEYNGVEMSENLRSTFSGTYYGVSAQDFVGHHQFVYTNGEGRVFRNELNFETVGFIAAPQTMKRGEKITILLTRQLTENESLVTTITSEEKRPESNSNSNVIRRGNTAGSSEKQYSVDLYQNLNKFRNSIEIDARALKDLVPGKAVLIMKVSANVMIQQKTKTGGSMRYTYTSGQFPLTISK